MQLRLCKTHGNKLNQFTSVKSGFLETIGKVDIRDFWIFMAKKVSAEFLETHGSLWLSRRGWKGCVSAKNSNSCHSMTCLLWEHFHTCHSVMWNAVHVSLGMQQEIIVVIFLVKKYVGDSLVIKMHVEMCDNNVCTNLLNGCLCHLGRMAIAASSL